MIDELILCIFVDVENKGAELIEYDIIKMKTSQ